MDEIRNPDTRLTAADVMTRDVITVQENIPAAEAAKLMILKSICGAPVVDDQGHCVGIFSAVDFFRIAQTLPDSEAGHEVCPYQLHHRNVDGCDVILCTLPVGQCPLQRPEIEEGQSRNTCRYPDEIVVDWQSFQPKLLPTDPVKRWMSAVPITVNSKATLAECAARMEQARIHSLIVIDDDQHIVGILNTILGLDAVAELALH